MFSINDDENEAALRLGKRSGKVFVCILLFSKHIPTIKISFYLIVKNQPF